MTAFEYLAVLVSLVLGLGVTHILAGIGLFANERGYQLFLAGSILFSGLFWALVVRRLLGGWRRTAGVFRLAGSALPGGGLMTAA